MFVRFVACVLLSVVVTGCGRPVVNLTPNAATPRTSRQVSGQPDASLETFMAKMRKLSTEAAPPRPGAATLESQDPRLGAALLAATAYRTPATHRAVAQEYQRLGVF